MIYLVNLLVYDYVASSAILSRPQIVGYISKILEIQCEF